MHSVQFLGKYVTSLVQTNKYIYEQNSYKTSTLVPQKTCAHSSVIPVQQQSVQGQNKGKIQFNDPLTVQKASFQFYFKDF